MIKISLCLASLGVAAITSLCGCGGIVNTFDDPDAATGDDTARIDSGVPIDGAGIDTNGTDGARDTTPPTDTPTTCKGLECKQVDCGSKPPTTVTGTVYAPNGTMPIYNATVYVPNGAIAPMPAGVQCDRCGKPPSGEPLAVAITDSKGHFELKNVPVDKDVPLVIELGKWRRVVKLPEVKACVENPITDTGLTRLPKNQTEGSMPKIAIATGECDKLACLLPKIGIDASEYGVKGSAAAVHFYAGESFGTPGGPPGMTPAKDFWSSVAELSKYDVVLFSCECTEAPSGKGATSYKAVADYLAAGGRIITSDFQYTWYKFSPDPDIQSMGVIPGGAPTGGNPIDLTSSFPKAKALGEWMTVADPSATPGKVTADYVFDNITSVDSTKTRTWGSSSTPSSGATHPRFVSLNVPAGKPASAQCGKAVHLDAHINNSDIVDASFPSGCKTALKNGEAAFAFLFFDVSTCIQDDTQEPKAPPLK